VNSNSDQKRERLSQGFVHVYTGQGKGKSTAALGLTLRAAGAGLRVFLAQFLKCGQFSEIKALKRFDDLVTVRQYGSGGFIKDQPEEKDFALARQGLEETRQALLSGEYDMVIMDEANVAVHHGLFGPKALVDMIDQKPKHVELIITGRHADKRVIEKADLVTELLEVKHYYSEGTSARKGVEF